MGVHADGNGEQCDGGKLLTWGAMRHRLTEKDQSHKSFKGIPLII